jgi:hypothetical protein
MKKFEPRYRLVRYGMATKVEKASRQQRTLPPPLRIPSRRRHTECLNATMYLLVHRQAAQEQDEDAPRYRQGQGRLEEEGRQISGCTITMTTKAMVGAEWRLLWNWLAWYYLTTAGAELQRASTCTAMKA